MEKKLFPKLVRYTIVALSAIVLGGFINEVVNGEAAVVYAASGDYTQPVTFVNRSGERQTTFTAAADVLGFQGNNSDGDTISLFGITLGKRYLVGWADHANVEQATNVYYVHQTIGEVYPDGIPAGAKLYAVYGEISPFSAGTLLGNNKATVNKTLTAQETLPNATIASEDVAASRTITAVYDGTKEKYFVDYTADFHINRTLSLLTYVNKGGVITNSESEWNTNEKARFNHVDLVIQLPDQLETKDVLHLEFESNNFYPYAIMTAHGQPAAEVMDPATGSVVELSDLSTGTSGKTAFKVKLNGAKKFIVRARPRSSGNFSKKLSTISTTELFQDYVLRSLDKENFWISKQTAEGMANTGTAAVATGNVTGYVQPANQQMKIPVIGAKPLHIKFEKAATYTVDYVFAGTVAPPTGEVPPAAVTDLADGAVVPIPENKTVIRPEGTYQLTWTSPVTHINGANVTVTGEWTFTPKTYKVTYKYAGTIPSGEVAPAVVTDLADGATIVIPDDKTVTRPEGTYALVWDRSQTNIHGADAEVVGVWTFTPATYKVTYKYTGDVPSGEVAPAALTGLLDGAVIAIPDDKTVTRPEGTYVLTWDRSQTNINGADAEVIGNWVFTATPPAPPATTYKVTYKYAGTIPSGEIAPAAVTDLVDGAVIVIPDDKTVIRPEGTYTLTWDRSQTHIHGADAEVIGVWTFTPTTYKVTYKYTGEVPSGEVAPAELTGLLDGAVIAIPDDKTVTRPEGTYVLTWDRSQTHINGADVEVVGNWVFTATPPAPPATTYKVTYKYAGAVPSGEVAPAAVTDLADGAAIIIPDDKTVTRSEGTYTLTWDRSQTHINGADVIVTGTWTYQPKGEVPNPPKVTPPMKNFYKVTYTYTGKIPNGEVAPDEVTGLEDGSEIVIPEDKTVTRPEGTYVLTWDRTQTHINGADVEVVGTWTFTPVPTTTPEPVQPNTGGVVAVKPSTASKVLPKTGDRSAVGSIMVGLFGLFAFLGLSRRRREE